MQEITNEGLKELLGSKQVADRSLYDKADIAAESRRVVEQMNALIERSRVLCALDAQQEADKFWGAVESAREDGNPDEFCFIGTRVRFHNGTLQAEWFRNRVSPARGSRPKQTFSTSINKGKGTRYSLAFTNKPSVPVWAQRMIAKVEDYYENVRRRSAALTDVRRRLNKYASVLEEVYKDTESNRGS